MTRRFGLVAGIVAAGSLLVGVPDADADPVGDRAAAGGVVSTVTLPGGRVISVTSGTAHPGQFVHGRLYSPSDVRRSVAGRRVAEPAQTLTIRVLDAVGKPGVDYSLTIIGVDNDVREDLYDADGTVAVTLPEGRYVVSSKTRTGTRTDLLFAPSVDLTRATTVIMDARLGRPLDFRFERGNVRPVGAIVGLVRHDGPSPLADWYDLTDTAGVHTAQIGSALPGTALSSFVLSQWAVPGAGGGPRNSPARYGLRDTRQGSAFTGLRRTVVDAELAAIRTRHNAQAADRTAQMNYGVGLPGLPIALGYFVPYDQPSETTVHLEPGVDWVAGAFDVDPDGTEVTNQYWPSTQTFAPGKHAETWNGAVFGPAFLFPGDVGRDGDRLWANVSMLSDGDGHGGQSQVDSATTRLYREDRLVAESQDPGRLDDVTVAPGPAGFRLEATATRPSWSNLSTRVEASWTFRSGRTSALTPLPLWTLRFHPAVDGLNRALAARDLVLPFTAEPQPGATVGDLAMPVVSVSGDDGKTWRPATVTRKGPRSYSASAPSLDGAGHVSLRVTATDAAGNQVQQTVIRAFGLRG